MPAREVNELLRHVRDRGAEPDGEEEYPCYARLRGPQQSAFMVEFRLADGTSDALDYGYLTRVGFHPSQGLVFHFAGVMVSVLGRNLRPLFEAVRDHRALWVGITAQPERVADDPEATVVTSIRIDAW